MATLAFATISELLDKLKSKEVTREELLEYFIKRFKEHDGKVKSALEIFDKESILKASESDGPLAGIPGILKNNINQKGRKLTCGSKVLGDFVSTYDATASRRLKESGALLMGNANMDEFAMGSSNEHSAFFNAHNPWDKERVPGGSSGGSIAAVAAGLVPWALGSETGGSVRLPAAFCGIVGLKPTYGLVSRSGLVAYASSLDQIGIATRTVKDNALVLSQIAGHDIKDSSSLKVGKKDYSKKLDTKELKSGLRIGVIKNAVNAKGIDSEVRSSIKNVIKSYKDLGATIKEVDLVTMDYSAAAYFILSRAEAASNLARFDGVRYGYRDKDAKTLDEMYNKTRHDGFGDDVRFRILVGNYVLSSGHSGEFYENAKKVQRLIRKDLDEIFKDVDVLLAPVHAAPAFKIGAYAKDKLQMDLMDYFTCFANLSGVPAISVPCGFTKETNLPIGFQLIGPHLSEELLYRTAYSYEQAHDWWKMKPPGF